MSMKRVDLPPKKRIRIVVLLLIATTIHLFSLNPQRVERVYSTGVYPQIGSILRNITGWLPFSIGDLLYASLVIYLVYRLVKLFRNRLWRQNNYWINTLFSSVSGILFIYIVFNLLWGLNYNRMGITHQLELENNKQYTKEELLQINTLLAEQVNIHKQLIISDKIAIPHKKELIRTAENIYQEAEKHFPFLDYEISSVKPSLIGWLGNYWGFSGYYNPFTGEAQINTDIPAFSQPFVALHEIAHQLGYAKENEANFAAFIASASSDDDLFKYSAYFDLFLYANRNLRRVDSLEASKIAATLAPAVKKDLEELKNYYRKFQNPVEPVIRWIYGKYLQANAQPSGMMSYSEVVADLIAYHKKYGTIHPLSKNNIH